MKLRSLFTPPPPKPLLPAEKVNKLYPKLRWNILEATFIGYATFYIVRNNLSTVAKDMQAVFGYDHSQIGSILAVSAFAYGLGKFLLGSVSDRSNVRTFMPFGLVLTALLNFAFGACHNYTIHFWLWALNGFIQGAGWPPCGRAIGHWFSVSERGTIFSIWNIAHNVGGGIAGVLAAYAASHFGMQNAFFIPGTIALICAVYLLWRLRDTPQSVGLPPIEEYRNDFPPAAPLHCEVELSTKVLFVDYILKNKLLWVVAFANFFVYIARYSMLDWGPMFLREVKGANITSGGFSVMILEFAGIPSTILFGWISDKLQGRRGMVSLLCMIPVVLAFYAIVVYPHTSMWFYYAMFSVIGFFVYPPVMMLGVMGLDLTNKKAVGTAAGFIGMFGYLGRTAQAKGFGVILDHFSATLDIVSRWNIVLYTIVACTVLSIVLLAFTWKVKPRG